jgi:hypothetical protein
MMDLLIRLISEAEAVPPSEHVAEMKELAAELRPAVPVQVQAVATICTSIWHNSFSSAKN